MTNRERVVLLVAAVVCFVLAALGGFHAWTWDHATAFGFIGLACFAGASIVR